MIKEKDDKSVNTQKPVEQRDWILLSQHIFT